mmetsp:Transcript_636/g.2304  ORF Transcript_636/g.2304 Transcript_636/m.2304 type:complete len:268 (-) Transcript_636:3837-4640(-)
MTVGSASSLSSLMASLTMTAQRFSTHKIGAELRRLLHEAPANQGTARQKTHREGLTSPGADCSPSSIPLADRTTTTAIGGMTGGSLRIMAITITITITITNTTMDLFGKGGTTETTFTTMATMATTATTATRKTPRPVSEAGFKTRGGKTFWAVTTARIIPRIIRRIIQISTGAIALRRKVKSLSPHYHRLRHSACNMRSVRLCTPNRIADWEELSPSTMVTPRAYSASGTCSTTALKLNSPSRCPPSAPSRATTNSRFTPLIPRAR